MFLNHMAGLHVPGKKKPVAATPLRIFDIKMPDYWTYLSGTDIKSQTLKNP